MKRILVIIGVFALAFVTNAQIPEKMSYQAVIRDAAGALKSNSSIGMKISILQGSESGTAVYVETQTTDSNENGLITIEIGDGTPITGTFGGIDWSTGVYFLKTETDPDGGTSYSIEGTCQLLTVPYSMHAKTAEKFYNSIEILFNKTDIDCFGGNNGTIDATISGGTPPYIYFWNPLGVEEFSGSLFDEDLQNLYAGIYVITAGDSTGNTSSKLINIIQPDPLEISYTTVNTVDNDGSIDISISGGTSPFAFSWSTGESTEDISGLAPGGYTVTVVDVNGCTNQETIPVYPMCNAVAIKESLNNVYEKLKWLSDDNNDGINDGYIDLIIMLNELTSDNAEFSDPESPWGQIANGEITPDNEILEQIWYASYDIIHDANAILETVDDIPDLNSEEKDNIEGQAKALRAFCHLNLVQLFGNVPYDTLYSSNWETLVPNPPWAGMPFDAVYGIESDLQWAKANLPETQPEGNTVINKYAAMALLAKFQIHIDHDDTGWFNADIELHEIISSGQYDLEEDFLTPFTSPSELETIWRLEYNPGTNNVVEYETPPGQYLYATENLKTEYSESDLRKNFTINDSLFIKITCDIPLIRYSEILLMKNKVESFHWIPFEEADLSWVNKVRVRAGLPILTNRYDFDFLAEKRLEMAMEGERWFDLARTNQTFRLFPIPQAALDANPYLIQNPGY